MAIRYGYVDPKEMNAFQVIEPGEGKFKIISAEEKTSEAGNHQMVVTMRLENRRGQSTLHREYLVQTNDPVKNKSTATKIYNILCAIGRGNLYGQELEPRHLERGQGECIIKTKKEEDPRYNDKSVVSQYIPTEQAMQNALDNSKSDSFDDDIPF